MSSKVSVASLDQLETSTSTVPNSRTASAANVQKGSIKLPTEVASNLIPSANLSTKSQADALSAILDIS